MTEESRIATTAADQPPFSTLLGIRIVSVTKDEVVMDMPVTEAVSNRNGVLHGGAVMGFADNVGGTAAMINLPEGVTTTTIESKTNFLRAVKIGDTLRGTATPIHRGSTTQVWQTTMTRDDGKVVAIVTQTQLTLKWKLD